MYVIMTSKTGKFRTEAGEALRPVAAYDYLFYGVPKARFIVAEVCAGAGPARVKVIDLAPPPAISDIPAKFLPHFDSIEAAERELGHLTAFGRMRTELRKVDLKELQRASV